MANIHVTIDDVSGSVSSGSTVLEAARQLGVQIPTLCDHPAIKPIGACRVCLVEIEKQRVLQPACTFPVSEGMVVHTRSPQVVDARRFVLQLLFSERNHFCMFCQMSGSCELQNLAYDYELDHWEFDRAFPKLSVDASREFFSMDHNRCILCRRCIRACDELVGNGTLGLKNRGAATMVIADMDVPFGESSCVSCGTCLQVCPTGALIDRASAYMGANKEVRRVKTTCTACSVGCGAELVLRENRVIRVEGDWDAEPNHGLLCQIGRFALLGDKRQRVRKPLVKGANGWAETDWDTALRAAAEGLRAAGGQLNALVSGFASSEGAQAVATRLPGAKALLEGTAAVAQQAPIAALDQADLYIVVETDMTVDYQVAGFAIKRGVRHHGARLILLGQGPNGLSDWALHTWTPAEADKALELARGAQAPAIVYGPAGARLAARLAAALPNATQVAFVDGGNARGVMSAGVSGVFEADGASACYVLAGEVKALPEAVASALKSARFVVAQASYRQPWDELADVILPTPTLFEKSGSAMNAEGHVGQLNAGVVTQLPSEVEVVERLGALL